MIRFTRIAHHLNLKNALVQILLALMTCPLIAFAQSDLPLKVTHLISGQWVSVDEKNTFLARVAVADTSHDAALARGLGFALEQAFGALILDEIEVKNGELTMHNTLSYRSAYIQQFKILEQRSEAGHITMLLDVWVQESQLSNRILGKSTATASMDWQTLNKQVLSFKQSRQEADLVLESVVRDFPYRAFQITLGRSEVVVDNRREPSLRIPFQIEWSRHFLSSLREALVKISHNPKCDSWLHRSTEACLNMFRVAMVGQTAYFDDELIIELLRKHLETDPPAVQLTVLDSEGANVYGACFSLKGLDPFEWAHRRFYEIGFRSYINEKLLISSHILVPLTRLNGKSASKLSLDTVRKSGCPKRQY